MDFRLLGPIELIVDDRSVHLGRRGERALLALLLLNANRIVPTEYLISTLFDRDRPPEPRKSIRERVSRIRRTLTAAGLTHDRVAVITHPGGYEIRLDPDTVDAHRFTRLTHRARATQDPTERAHLARAALALWRGPALAGVGTDRLRTGERLEEERLSALEIRIDADLALGHHDDLVAELAELTANHPTRDRLVAARMLALYRAGRAAEALTVYEDTRRILAERLGVDPSETLRAMHVAILRDDVPAPTAPPTGASVGPTPPAQLPAPVRGFAGRDHGLSALDRELTASENRPALVVISGMAGVGKTTLAIHWAHRVRDAFPDGQLYVDLRGFGPAAAMTPAEAVRGFLDALGVPAHRVPADRDSQLGLYRSLLADRRALIILDNAKDAAQVRPLLPGGPSSVVLVTSRDSLTGLIATEGARPLMVNPLTDTEARDLLTNRLGADRVSDEPTAVGEIIARCGHLPLALAVVAARAATHDRFALSTLATELGDSDRGLDALRDTDPGTDVRATFSWSYRHLPDHNANLFRRLGLHPGPDLTAEEAAALAGVPTDRAGRALADLTAAHLVTEYAPGRFSLHDLLRGYAAELARTDPEPDRQAAITRLFEYDVKTATAAVATLYPFEGSGQVTRFTTTTEAADWLDARRAHLLAAASQAADEGWPRVTAQLSMVLQHHLRTRAHHDDAQTLHTHALRSARATGDRTGEAHALHALATALRLRGRTEEALDRLLQSLDIARAVGDPTAELRALIGLGNLRYSRGQYQPAERCLRAALPLARLTGYRNGELGVLIGLADLSRIRHQPDRAHDYYHQALRIARDTANHTGELNALIGIGTVHHQRGQYRDAIDQYQRALAIAERTGHRNGQFEALHALGRAHHALGDPAGALAAHRRALRIAVELRQPPDEARAHDRIAHAYHALGRIEDARDQWGRALAILAEVGITRTEDLDADQISATLTDLGP